MSRGRDLTPSWRSDAIEFGKQPIEAEPVSQTIAGESWWIPKQREGREEFHKYRTERLLKSDGKLPRAVGE